MWTSAVEPFAMDIITKAMHAMWRSDKFDKYPPTAMVFRKLCSYELKMHNERLNINKQSQGDDIVVNSEKSKDNRAAINAMLSKHTIEIKNEQ